MKLFSGSLAVRFIALNSARVVVGIALVLSVAFSAKSLVEANAELDRSHQVVQQTLIIDGLIKAQVMDAQAYLISDNRSFLSTFYNRNEVLAKELQQALLGGSGQQARLEEITLLVNDWVAKEVQPAIAKKQSGEVLEVTVLPLDNTRLGTLMTKLSTLKADEKQHLGVLQGRVTEASESTRVLLVICAVLLAVSGLGFSLLAGIGIPRRMRHLVKATQSLVEGNLDISVKRDSSDEIGVLSLSLNQMVQRLRHVEEVAQSIAAGDFSKQVQVRSRKDRLPIAINKMSQSLRLSAKERGDQDWLSTGVSELHYKMRGEHEVVPLTQLIITHLARHLKAQVGVFYLAEGGRLRLVSSYAYQQRNNNDTEFGLGEGLIGQAALERQTLCYSQIPEGQNPLTINSGMGESQPIDVVVLPLVHEDEVEAVLSLGANHKYSEIELEFLEKVAESIAISIHVTRTQQQLALLLEESRLQSEKLQAQQEELRAANEELEEHASMLANSEESLRNKSNELQQLNTELEERTEELERQKAETDHKNREIEKAKQAVEAQAKNLAQASQYKSEFLANMSHELRTPLNSLLILSQSLSNNRTGNLTEEQVDDVKVIYQGGKALLGLINDILDLSKVEAGKLDIRFEETRIGGILEALSSQFSPIANEKGVALVLEKEEGLPDTLCSDPLRVEQVLRNLLSNGFKFTHQGSVHLRVSLPQQPIPFSNTDLTNSPVIAFVVTDTGIGIPEDKQKGVFEAFQQADGSTSRNYGGTGLGLTISRELVRMLGGEIHLQSEVGQGSTFTLYLPLRAAPEWKPARPITGHESCPKGDIADVRLDQSTPFGPWNPETQQPRPVSSQVPGAQLNDDREALTPGTKSVLIIEDDQAFARILFDLSRKKGYLTLAALTGSDGLQLAEEYQPSAIILDLGLPDISGRQVLEQLKDNIKTRHIPVHVLSAEDKDHQVMQMGAVGFLTKPVSGEVINTLFSKIESLLQNSIKQVLLVEDDSSNRQAVIRLIANQDVEICAVGTGREAHERLRVGSFDCMILDLSLPDVSGFELLSELSQDERIVLPPVVVYTGRELTNDEYKELNEYTASIVIKGASSPERLLDETTLFLHSVETSLPNNQRNIIQMLHSQEQLLQGRKVLLVDDDLRNTYALSKALREHGLEVVMADNGALALERLAQEEGIELVLMDIMMPVMDGYEAMHRIRQQPALKKLPIIALTAKAMPEDRMKSIEAGANDYCTKPVDVDRLISMIRVWLFR